MSVQGLGRLLALGDSPQRAVKGLVRDLNRHRIFPGAANRLHGWAKGLGPNEPRSVEELRAKTGKPVIGIQINRLGDLLGDTTAKGGARRVASAIRRAGGEPVFLPPGCAGADARSLLENVDHLVLLGGADVHPSLYGQRITHANRPRLRLGRDRSEQHVIKAADELGLGIDGICRGMQLLNVAYGGTLHQDLHKEQVTRRPHRRRRTARRQQRHLVKLDARSQVAKDCGTRCFFAPSSHHQSVRTVAPGFKVVGRALDGVVEAIEGKGGRVRGYQYHPEDSRTEPNQAIFRSIVRRAREHRGRRTR